MEVNRWKERHNEKSREVRMMLLRMPSQLREAIELENKKVDEVVQWDSPERKISCPKRATKKSSDRSRSPLKPLQLGNSWTPGKLMDSYYCCFSYCPIPNLPTIRCNKKSQSSPL